MRQRQLIGGRTKRLRRVVAAAVVVGLCGAPSVSWAASDAFDTALSRPSVTTTQQTVAAPKKIEKQHAESSPDAPPRGAREWWLEKREILGDAPDMVRYVANECILAGVAAAAVVVALAASGGTIGPTAAAALGVTPEMSPLGITVLGCVAGASAGVASAAAIYAYEEPETVREFAVAQVQYIQNAVATATEAVSQPDKMLNAAVENVQWAVAGVVGGIVNGITGGFGSSEVMVADTGKTIPAVSVTGEAAVSAVSHSWWGNKAEDGPALSSFSVADVPGLGGSFNAVATY